MEEAQIQFIGFKISKINLEINEIFYNNSNQRDYKLNIENSYAVAEDISFGEHFFSIKITTEDNSFFLELNLKGGFKNKNINDKEIFENLMKKNAAAILFPYARSAISNLTLNANIPPLILPLINLTKNDAKKVKYREE